MPALRRVLRKAGGGAGGAAKEDESSTRLALVSPAALSSSEMPLPKMSKYEEQAKLEPHDGVFYECVPRADLRNLLPHALATCCSYLPHACM